MNKKILIVAAHPDDEILGAGGTLLKHSMDGDKLYCLILGKGLGARGKASPAALKKQQRDASDAGKIIGFEKIFFSNMPDNSFDTVSLLSITKIVENHLSKIRPDIVYTHHGGDLNIDHRLAFQAVITASRPCNGDCPKAIYAFETLSSTEWQADSDQRFVPDVFVDIGKTIDKKIKAMEKYVSEIRKYPHPRSAEGIRTLARYRGMESGLEAAEAFCLVREIR